MTRLLSTAVLVALTTHGVLGLVFNGPASTISHSPSLPQSAIPTPTENAFRLELVKRQSADGNESTVELATCGWYSTGELACRASRTCVFFEPKNTFAMVGCCIGTDYANCRFANTCYDYDELQTDSNCDSACYQNSFAWKCSDTSSRFCQTWTYPERNAQDFGCGPDGASTITTILATTFDGNDTLTVDPVVLSNNEVTGFQKSTPTSTSRSSSSSSSSSASSSSTSGNKGGSSNTGAIVGGAVGGAVALLLIAIGVVILVLRNKRRKQSAAAAAVQPAQAQPGMADPHYGGGGDKFPVAAGTYVPPNYEQNNGLAYKHGSYPAEMESPLPTSGPQSPVAGEPVHEIGVGK